MSDTGMTMKRSRLRSTKQRLRTWQIERGFKKNKRKSALVYSQSKGLLYSIVFSLLLWWIPIAGPAIAGYLSGRKSGSVGSALTSSLVATAIITFLTLSLLPFKSGVLAFFGGYLSTGIQSFSQSKLISFSNITTDLYTAYGIIRTFTIIIPSSLVTLNIFSYIGGFHSTLKAQEENFSHSYMTKSVEDKLVSFRNKPKVKLEKRVIREFNDGGNDEESVGGWSYL